MELEALLADIEKHVEEQYREHQDPRVLYHDINHTHEVVSSVITISGYYGLSEEERFPIIAAAWFHDLAYIYTGPEDHERKSAVFAREFLTGKGVDEELIKKVEGCIMATHIPQQAETLQEKIIADADLFHFGKSIFQEKSDLLRKELELLSGNPISGSEWRANTLRFMENHHYFTEFARQVLQPTKDAFYRELKAKHEKKLAKQAQKQAEQEAKVAEAAGAIASPALDGAGGDLKVQPIVKAGKKNKLKDDERPSRGIETLFRLTSRNHMELSALADNKAGIMISVNSIILSVILSVLLRKLEDSPHLILPTITMLMVNITTIIFAVLATRPKIIGTQISQEDIRDRKINLLFFGHFNKMRLEEYQNGIRELLSDRDYLYSSLTKDIYYLGVVLGKKYNYLRWSYSVFMYGLIVSVITFGLAVYLYSA